MSHDEDSLLWEAFVIAALAVAPAEERRSLYGDKPALFTASREMAHLEAPGVIDLRITRAGWSRVREDFGDDPALRRDPSRRDWIELHLRSEADLDRLAVLLVVAMAANALLVNSVRPMRYLRQMRSCPGGDQVGRSRISMVPTWPARECAPDFAEHSCRA